MVDQLKHYLVKEFLNRGQFVLVIYPYNIRSCTVRKFDNNHFYNH